MARAEKGMTGEKKNELRKIPDAPQTKKERKGGGKKNGLALENEKYQRAIEELRQSQEQGVSPEANMNVPKHEAEFSMGLKSRKRDSYNEFRVDPKYRTRKVSRRYSAYVKALAVIAVPAALFGKMAFFGVAGSVEQLDVKHTGKNERRLEYNWGVKDTVERIPDIQKNLITPQLQQREVVESLSGAVLPERNEDLTDHHYLRVKLLLDALEENKIQGRDPSSIEDLQIDDESKELLYLFEQSIKEKRISTRLREEKIEYDNDPQRQRELWCYKQGIGRDNCPL